MSATTPGELKNIIDALRRALQLPASDVFPTGGVTSTTNFDISITPAVINHPQGTSATYGPRVIVESVNGFNGTVTLSRTNFLCDGATSTLGASSLVVTAATFEAFTTLTITIPTSCPSGDFRVQVTGTSGTLTNNATVTIHVSGTPPCLNNQECCGGSGCICDGGKCLGLCCSNDPFCQQSQGPCSTCQPMVNCPDPNCDTCSRCTVNQDCGQITLACPGEIDLFSGVSGTITNSFTVTSVNFSGTVNVSLSSIIPCMCCGAGPSLSPSSFTLAVGGSQTVTITVPEQCDTVECYEYQLSIATINQSFTCALRICVVKCASTTGTLTCTRTGDSAQTIETWGITGTTKNTNFCTLSTDTLGFTAANDATLTATMCVAGGSTNCGSQCGTTYLISTNLGNTATFCTSCGCTCGSPSKCWDQSCASGGASVTMSGKWCPS